MFNLNQKGLIHLIPLFLILVGIIGGVYLVQKSGYQIFKPKAAGGSIQFIDHSQSSTSCVTVKDNKQVTTCPTIQFKLTSPLENQSYNILPGLVSTVYAHDQGLDKNESKRCDSFLGVHVVRSNKRNSPIVETCWPGAQECRTYQFEDGHDWARCVRTTFPPCDGEIDWERGRDICKPKAQPAGPGAPAQPSAPQGPTPECSNDTACVDGNACTEDSCQDGKCVHTNSPAGKVCIVSSRATCDENGECVSAPEETPSPEPTSTPRPTARPSRPSPSAVPTAAPSVPSQGSGPTIIQCKDGPAGTVTAAQAQCVINLRSDILPFYQKNSWCVEERDYPGIINNWIGINNQADKDQVKGCFEGGATTTRVTKKYRFAETPDKFQDRDYGWKTYTAGGVKETITFTDSTPGPKFIYAQFEDDQGNIINASPYPAQIELVVPTQPTPTPPPAAQTCAQGNCSACVTITPCSDKSVRTYDSCEDDKNQRYGTASFCQNGATRFRCNSSQTSVCTSNPDLSGATLESRYAYSCFDCGLGGTTNTPTPQPTFTPTPTPSSRSIPAGSECSTYVTTSVCGGGFTTYDKCTDDKGQTGSSLCSGGAVQFYCEGSTNSNCISSTTRTPHYYCSACPNLNNR